MQNKDGVQTFFERESGRFDNIYAREKRPLHKIVDLLFHGTIQKRFEMTLAELAPFEGRSILDVGCGSGRYGVEFAVRGARRVLGMDFAEKMITLAESYAAERGAEGACEFVCTDFLSSRLDEVFDAAVAIGFFEYFNELQPLFDKIAAHTRGTVIISFPKLWTLRTFPRMIRYRLRRCYLRFFTKKDLERIVRDSIVPIRRFTIHATDRDYLLVCQTDRDDARSIDDATRSS